MMSRDYVRSVVPLSVSRFAPLAIHPEQGVSKPAHTKAHVAAVPKLSQKRAGIVAGQCVASQRSVLEPPKTSATLPGSRLMSRSLSEAVKPLSASQAERIISVLKEAVNPAPFVRWLMSRYGQGPFASLLSAEQRAAFDSVVEACQITEHLFADRLSEPNLGRLN